MNEKPIVTEDNYEEFLLLQADGELNPGQEAALARWLAEHPEAAEELNQLQGLRLQPDETIVFAGKESLLRPAAAPARKTIAFGGSRLRYAAAAALLLALLGSALIWQLRQGDTPGDGYAVKPADTSHRDTSFAVNPTGTALQEFYRQQEQGKGRSKPRPQQAPARRTPGTNTGGGRTQRGDGSVRLAANPATEGSRRPAVLSLPQLPPPTAGELPAGAAAAPSLAFESVPPAPQLKPGQRELSVSVPVASMLREEASERWQQLRKTAGSVRDASFALRIGNKDLISIRF